MSPLGKAALGYVERLMFCVFPTADDCRVPRIEGGVHSASCDPEQIKDWWGRWPDANIALACGLRSGVFVLDVDQKPDVDGEASLARLVADYGPLPEGWASKTPGGRHLFFRQPDAPLRNRVNLAVDRPGGERVKYPGLDIRSTGGSVALAPSRKASGAYVWERHPLHSPMADAPGWLLEIIDPPVPVRPPPPPIRFNSTDRMARYVEAAVNEECGTLAGMKNGSGRNQQLFQASANLFSLVAADLLPQHVAEGALERAADACGLIKDDGMHSVRATINSGARRGFAKPREVVAQ